MSLVQGGQRPSSCFEKHFGGFHSSGAGLLPKKMGLWIRTDARQVSEFLTKLISLSA